MSAAKMSLQRLYTQGRLTGHKTSKQEVRDLLRLIERDIRDAKVDGISSDRKFVTAYNAVLQAATILLYCQGYRTKGAGHHFTVFQAMKEIIGQAHQDLADYFDACRVKRNITDYTHVGEISATEVEELIKEAEQFLNTVVGWLKANHPEFV